MSTQGGRWSKKSQNLVNVVCERPLALARCGYTQLSPISMLHYVAAGFDRRRLTADWKTMRDIWLQFSKGKSTCPCLTTQSNLNFMKISPPYTPCAAELAGSSLIHRWDGVYFWNKPPSNVFWGCKLWYFMITFLKVKYRDNILVASTRVVRN